MLYNIEIYINDELAMTTQANHFNGVVKPIRRYGLIDKTKVKINGIMIECKELKKFNSVEMKRVYKVKNMNKKLQEQMYDIEVYLNEKEEEWDLSLDFEDEGWYSTSIEEEW